MTTPTHLQDLAGQHLWGHFSPIGASRKVGEVPVLVRGEGCYVYDERGKPYLDGLSGLFCVNAGHGRVELADAAARQGRALGYAPLWGYAHPAAIELATQIADLAPPGLDRVFFTSGGSEAVESALKLARAFHRANGAPSRTKVIARQGAYHGTSLGALAATGIEELSAQFLPVVPGGCHVPNTNEYRLPPGVDPLFAADAVATEIEAQGPDTVAAVIVEPVQNSGGCMPPPPGYFQRLREICDAYGVLLISDEIVCAWGRLGEYFGCDRFGYRPDMITVAKGVTSGYAPMGALLVSREVQQPFAADGGEVLAHGFTFGGHPVSAAVALANLEIFEREALCERVRRLEAAFRGSLERLLDIPIVGDVRTSGFLAGIELVADKDTKTSFSAQQRREVLHGFVGGEFLRRGVICRAEDRSSPVIQLAPPLIAEQEHFDEIAQVLFDVLGQAAERIEASTAPTQALRAS